MTPKNHPAASPKVFFEDLEIRQMLSAASVAHHKHHDHAHHNNHTAHHHHSRHHHHARHVNHHDHILHHDHKLHGSRRGSGNGGGSSNPNNIPNQTGPITLFTLPRTRTISAELQAKIDAGLPLFG